ncbi:F-box/LRR-repeat protein At3g58900 isoform X2 [Beta vulgaris subsp. vulgaris]|uniref:F-box/LRR-repeat protein At3g58900 isoform X2 n=1 Tax=Beta vulgaris subsp. vulgaris TaxID=3555 RepID=UPI002036D827|nr:F-box/LRR-repeat protein At3g58900 isoform X2 [Beta vulgaris subsp. vulgaris]
MKMEKKVHLQTSSDRISNLPESLKHRILSFLSTRDAVRTIILSNSWRTAWAKRPSLDLSSLSIGSSLREDTLSGSNKDDDALKAKRERFYDFLDRAFTFRLITKLDKFKLYVPCFGLELKDRLDHWLGRAVLCQVRNLDLEIGGEGPRYSVARSVLNASSITKLRLKKCELNLSSLRHTQLPRLRVLDLTNVYLDEVVMGRLLASCPNLEEFTCGYCYGLTRLEISGLTKIETVCVILESKDQLKAIKIKAPSLLEFSYMYRGSFDEESCNIALLGCRNLKKLELDRFRLMDCDIFFLLDRFPVLEKLIFRDCHNLEFVKISSKHLVDLDLCGCRKLEKAEINTPNLQSFSFYVETGQDIISLVSKGHTLKLKYAHIHLIGGAFTDQWYVRLIKLFAVLSHSDRFYIYVRSKEFTYEMPLKRKENCGCWKSLHVNCWRHSLNKVLLESQKRDADNIWRENKSDNTALAHFFCNARIDGKTVSFVEE